jgi:hypothetical protein
MEQKQTTKPALRSLRLGFTHLIYISLENARLYHSLTIQTGLETMVTKHPMLHEKAGLLALKLYLKA